MLIFIALSWNCHTIKYYPNMALNEVKFVIPPYILDSMGSYFLVYQVDT